MDPMGYGTLIEVTNPFTPHNIVSIYIKPVKTHV
jgi:hypothetical protein